MLTGTGPDDYAPDIGVVCSDFDASMHLYHELLGFPIEEDVRIPEQVAIDAHLAPTGFRQVRLRVGRTLLKLMEIENPPPPRSAEFQAGIRWLTIFVPDIDATYQRLTAAGIEFLSEPVSAFDAVGFACVLDPDGLLVELLQPRDRG